MAAAIRDSGGTRAALRELRREHRIAAAMLPPEVGFRIPARMQNFSSHPNRQQPACHPERSEGSR